MNKIAEIFKINRRIESELQTAAALLHDAEVVRALRFLNDLDELACKFQFTPREILMYLAPRKESSHLPQADQGVIEKVPAKTVTTNVTRSPREYPVKIYKNPHTGALIETRGGNHTALKKWKSTYGGAVVEGWRID
ncbi:histone-like nucleoid-structuring protein, MvaT/MvaU family [Pseudomonas sp. UFMG81]|uniref:histone-like nucleoid-structuring protein, MvaT/MvaU family n=1 Tax=Pseudomonas sp. UFMG81 TaxID=2745936 RepID=UPI00188E97CC|nr:histone-like nucleoid-structuring protein, MvaT/MvaU family [Pseudomonas sp. UFMG81]